MISKNALSGCGCGDRIAKQRGIAAFCIFHDSTLKTLAEQQPSTMDDLRGIPGMGPKKLADYGDAVLRAIAER